MDLRACELQRIAASRSDVIGLAGALPARELIPRDPLARAFADVTSTRGDALQYGWPEGDAALRTWIANRLAARGANIDPAQVIVTAGAQQALSIVAEALAGSAIAVGEATYAGALDAFARAGVHAVVAGGDASYVIPGVANPQGIALDELPHASVIVADEAYAELRFDGKTPRPLLADHQVWHIGTISKTLAPGLRIGWLVPPRAHHAAALAAKQASDLQSASITQVALARMLERFDYDAHLARVRACYAARAAALADALRRYLPGACFREPEGGLSLWIELGAGGDELAVLEAALACGVMIDPGSAFRPQPCTRLAFRASFANASPAQLVDGARRLARAMRAA